MRDAAERENEVKEARERLKSAKEVVREANTTLERIAEEEKLAQWRDGKVPIMAWPDECDCSCWSNGDLLGAFIKEHNELASLRKSYDEARAAGVDAGMKQNEAEMKRIQERAESYFSASKAAQRELAKLRSELEEKDQIIQSMPEATAMAKGIIVFMRMLGRASKERSED